MTPLHYKSITCIEIVKKSFRNSYVFLVWHNITYVKYPQSQGGFVLKGRAHDIQLQFYFITGALNVRQTPWIGEPAGITKHYGCYRRALRSGVVILASRLGNDRWGEEGRDGGHWVGTRTAIRLLLWTLVFWFAGLSYLGKFDLKGRAGQRNWRRALAKMSDTFEYHDVIDWAEKLHLNCIFDGKRACARLVNYNPTSASFRPKTIWFSESAISSFESSAKSCE